MTNEERRKAFDMRLQGASFREIADVLHYSHTAIEGDLLAVVRRGNSMKRHKYPVLTNAIAEQFEGKTYLFAEACDINVNTMYTILTGHTSISPANELKIYKATGLHREDYDPEA